MLDFREAWTFSRGAGQKVAVIDTGVAPNPRLPALQPGGDYVSSSNGLVDCDAHGTLIAGLIAAAPSPDDAFAGVAPDATILSIRQNSSAYAPAGSNTNNQDDPNAVSPGYGNTLTLALAITHAVDLGATVINVSQVACAPVGTRIEDAMLGQALRYAFERNVVTVAAASDINSQGLCRTQNEPRDPNLPLADAWNSTRTVSRPAWFADYVLTVGAVAPDASPAAFSLHGPWVDVAAPGQELTSLNPNGIGLTNALLDPQKGPMPINGTGYATPLVSGVVALVRARFPNLSAGQVMDRIERTAHTPEVGPNAATGYGIVDPVAALTFDVPPADQSPNPLAGRAVADPVAPHAESKQARHVVLAVLGGCAMLAAVVGAVAIAMTKGSKGSGSEANDGTNRRTGM